MLLDWGSGSALAPVDRKMSYKYYGRNQALEFALLLLPPDTDYDRPNTVAISVRMQPRTPQLQALHSLEPNLLFSVRGYK